MLTHSAKTGVGSLASRCVQALLSRPTIFRLALSLYPPYAGSGVWVKAVSADFRRIEVRMHHHFFNQNSHGSHFGGSLFAMADPFHALMLAQILGPEYRVWDQAGSIEFVSPGRGTVSCVLEISEDQIEEVVRATASGRKHLFRSASQIVDARGCVVATLDKVVYVRRSEARLTAAIGAHAIRH